ncbi:hypothetical protein ACUY3M_06045 [Corynebacterium suicordis]|uniref:Uncharacterized protein n=1 Tax=Corynebacterium suicordis DSM 45110 TaxID=1121369 RepID=A0ABR9ZLB1_9CORY|nr:hypothetical protein [Corynebacterium suicordis]MBF4553901.1 hypothetical protein [Corynebacterium suicordis DSM 45110]MDR6277122.1 cell division protein FtsX [Corynebacterium suicordis]
MDNLGLAELIFIILSVGITLFIPAVLIAILIQLKKLNNKLSDKSRSSSE